VTSLEQVRARIADACTKSGRAADAVRLIAVSKTFPVERIDELLAQGQQLFGENRVQEAIEKVEHFAGRADFHFIGHLQRNKAKQVIGRFALIHGVDDPRLIHELGRRSVAAKLEQPILLQVNSGDETTKSGVTEAQLPELLDRAIETEGVTPVGLMTIPPRAEQPEDNRRWFARLRELRDREASRCGIPLPELSMGMTDDYKVAVEEGATLVRVGRAIFGER